MVVYIPGEVKAKEKKRREGEILQKRYRRERRKKNKFKARTWKRNERLRDLGSSARKQPLQRVGR
jgi:hypothetical protein